MWSRLKKLLAMYSCQARKLQQRGCPWPLPPLVQVLPLTVLTSKVTQPSLRRCRGGCSSGRKLETLLLCHAPAQMQFAVSQMLARGTLWPQHALARQLNHPPATLLLTATTSSLAAGLPTLLRRPTRWVSQCASAWPSWIWAPKRQWRNAPSTSPGPHVAPARGARGAAAGAERAHPTMLLLLRGHRRCLPFLHPICPRPAAACMHLIAHLILDHMPSDQALYSIACLACKLAT